ncbi:MAG: hypothetical protein ACPGD8_00930 [Flavobacteriales bacterium]
MKNLITLILLSFVSVGVFAQDGHITYNEHSNYKMYGRDVLNRSNAANLDTLTNVYNGTIAFDTAKNHVVAYDAVSFRSLAFGEVKDTVIDLSSAEILALGSTPKTVVPAPGSGKLLQVLNATVKYTYVTATYTGGTMLRVGTNISQDAYICQALDATVSTIRTFTTPIHTTAGYVGSAENTAIEIDTTSTASTGDGTAKVWVRYQVIEL